MSSFTYFTSQTNLTVNTILHHSVPHAPVEFYNHFPTAFLVLGPACMINPLNASVALI